MSQTRIPANEAESHFGELLARVEQGEQVEIHRDGVHVATVVPAEHHLESVRAAIERNRVRRQRIIDEGRGMSLDEILQARDEGRR